MFGGYDSRVRGRRDPRRFRHRRVAYALQWTLSLLILVMLGALFYRFLVTSPSLSVQWIQVGGTRMLEPNEVLRASGVTKADNMVRLDLAAVRQRVEALPYVKTCRVDRVFPDQVLIEVEERVPVATLLVNNHLFALDGEGVVLREIPSQDPYPGPLVTNVPEAGSVEAGQQLAQPALVAALAVWDAFSGVPMAADVTVSELAALGPDEILMFCNELPFEVRWGRKDFVNEARRLNVLWQQKNKQLKCQEYLDLRFGNDLVCK